MKATKKEIVHYILEKLKELNPDEYPTLGYSEVLNAVNILIEKIEEYVAEDNTIEIRGFGTFIPRKRKARVARVPKKGGPEVMLPERYVPVIKFSGLFKEYINSK